MADEGLNFEAWTMPHVGALARKFTFSKGPSEYTFNDRFNDLCDGVFVLPDDFPNIDKLLSINEANHALDEGSMVRILRGDTPIMHFITTRSETTWSDSEPVRKFSVEGLEWLLDRALVPNYDDPADPTVDPDWIYGADSILTNSTFEESPTSNEIQYVWVEGMSGANTFTLTYSGQTTTSLAWNADWFAVGSALEALSNIQDVTVSGSGTALVPWIVEFLDPAGDIAQMTITPSAGTGSVATNIPGGQRYPEPWTTSYNPETGEPHGTYQNFQITNTQAHTGTYSLLVNAGASTNPLDYPGAQQIVNVTPGRTYRAEIWVRASFSSTFRLVVRTTDETLIAQSAGDSTPVTANTWTQLTIAPFVIPAHVTRVIFRIGLIDSTDRGEWFVDDPVLAPGFPAATLGYMMNDIRTAAVAGGVLTWLTPTWTTTLDSDGNAWDQPRSWNVNHGQTFLQLFEYCRKWNYEFRIRWDAGDARFEWDMWNPLGGGQARANIAITGKSGVMGSAPIVKRPPNATYVKVEGERGTWGEFASTTLDDVWGRLEKFQQDRQGVHSAELDELATRLITRQTENTASRAVTLSDPSLLPWQSYEPGDTLTVNLSPKDDKRTLRVAAIVVSKGPNDAAPRYDVHFGAPVYSDPVAAASGLTAGGSSAIAQGLRTLIREFRRPVFNPPAGESEAQPPLTMGGGGGAPTLVVGASNASTLSQAKVDTGYQCTGTGDATIIQNAINAMSTVGGRVVLTEGTFNIAATITAPYAVRIEGLGRDATILRQTNGANLGAVLNITAGAFSLVPISLMGFTVDGNKANQTAGVGNGIAIPQAAGRAINAYDVQVINCRGTGYYSDRNGGADLLTLCRFASNTGDGVALLGDGLHDMSTCVSANNTGNGVQVAGGAGIIADCVISGNGADGIDETGTISSGHWIYVGNRIYSNTGHGIDTFTTFTGLNSIIGNHVYSNGGSGMRLGGNEGHDLATGNAVYSNTDHGIYVGAHIGTAVTANEIYSNGKHGVLLEGSDECLVASNQIDSNGKTTNNTFDGINVDTDADENYITANKIRDEATAGNGQRYGINIANANCNLNVYVGNDARGAGRTADYNNAGTGTVILYPAAAAPQGDNF